MQKVNAIIKKIASLSNRQTEKRKIQDTQNALKQFRKPYKLHIGCGLINFLEWINIDIEEQPGIVNLVWDVSNGLSFLESASCDLIYNEHFLEHLTIDCAKVFLSESYRVLRPNGTLRIAMPSLEYVIDKYKSGNWREQDWLKLDEYQFILTKAEMINIAFRWWGHQWLYDREELHRRLREAGFRKIKDVNWGSSEILELRNLETRKDSLLICEAQK
ncbi:class I SAM-dependent methyltransferase [Pseudanabaena sp. PCC 6802]|uniref:class I SAM-dependent methyltransferase n=1 Tax=Pseudanabaena sp. PCC 6802 TaxID=118173 RepID=UPI0003481812|nr:methyltransferase domain-containing protein [Pseudanabaena sp. PCC 6802]